MRIDLTKFLRAESPREYSVANPSSSDSSCDDLRESERERERESESEKGG